MGFVNLQRLKIIKALQQQSLWEKSDILQIMKAIVESKQACVQ